MSSERVFVHVLGPGYEVSYTAREVSPGGTYIHLQGVECLHRSDPYTCERVDIYLGDGASCVIEHGRTPIEVKP